MKATGANGRLSLSVTLALCAASTWASTASQVGALSQAANTEATAPIVGKAGYAITTQKTNQNKGEPTRALVDTNPKTDIPLTLSQFQRDGSRVYAVKIAGDAAKEGKPILLAAETAGREGIITRDSLFSDVDDAPKKENAKESLFGDDLDLPKKESAAFSSWKGFIQAELARTIVGPAHWSKMLTRAEFGKQGNLGEEIKWKASARVDYNAVYDHDNYYATDVRNDQRLNFTLLENYVDIGAGDWDFRLGRQHVVWGEMVGLFFADVVSAKDMREFILPEFEVLRIPQWAARAEYFKDDFHAELLWIPVASYDEIGKPGAEFFPWAPPAPSGYATVYNNEIRPNRNLDNANSGLRLSTLQNGWDVSGFYYRSMDSAPTFYRDIVTVPQPTFVYEARHDRIEQFGGTVAKDLGSAVLKGEAVYTHGRKFNVLRLNEPDGVVPQDTFDWAAGLDFTLPADTRLNLQLFQRVYLAHDPDIIPEKYENGCSVLLNSKLTDHIEAQALWISSLNRSDWVFRPRLAWTMEKNWRLLFGFDIFKGPPLGMFGRFDKQDRAYTEIRYSF
jgi:hypothetical protein